MKNNHFKLGFATGALLFALGVNTSLVQADSQLNLTTPEVQEVNLHKNNALKKTTIRSILSACDSFSIGNSKYTRGDAVDVSSYQSKLTLTHYKVMKNSGVKTIIVKVSEGTYYKNPYAKTQIANAKAAGLKVAVYHYATFGNSSAGASEGRYLASAMKSLGLAKNTLVFADMEDSTTMKSQVKNGLNSFWSALNSNGYTNHGVYVYQSYPYRDAVISTVGKARTWLAQYPYSPTRGGYYETQWKNQGYGAWQFSSTAHVYGYWNLGNLDLSTDFNGLLTNGSSTTTTNGWVGNKYYKNGKAVTGQQYISGKWYLFDSNGNKLTGFQYIASQKKTCYYNSQGQMLYGQQYINKHWYLFDKITGAMKTGFQNLSAYGQNKICYYNSQGQMLYGRQYINGSYYYFNPTTGAELKNGFVTINNKTYYFGSDGKEIFGKLVLGAKTYVFDAKTGALTSSSNNSRVTGWQTISGKTYYYQNGKAVTGVQTISGKTYLFDAQGGLQKNGLKTWNKKTYYAGADGVLQSGQKLINGKWYLFSKTDYTMQTGFQNLSAYGQNKICYYNWQGQMKYGQQYIGGKWYLFNKVTGARMTGFQNLAAYGQRKTCYYNSQGQMLYGRQYINGRWYNFNRVTGALQ